MIWLLFRIFSAALLGGTVAFFVMNRGSFESLESTLISEEEKLKAAELLIGLETNSTEANISALLKINREYRKQLEQLEEASSGASEELSFLLPKVKSLTEQLNSSQKELGKAEEEIAKVEAIILVERQRMEPLKEQKEESIARLSEVSLAHSSAEMDWQRLDQNLSSLNRIRQAALENFNNARNPLMEEIIRPFEIFYGDSIVVEIDSVSEKEKGFFIKWGLEQGICSGFNFLVQTDENWNEMPVYVTCSLAEKQYSFLKLAESLASQVTPSFRKGEKLTLIRSAELTNPISSSNFDDEKTLSPIDL